MSKMDRDLTETIKYQTVNDQDLTANHLVSYVWNQKKTGPKLNKKIKN